MSNMSPTQRALADLKKVGHTAQVVERWNAHAKVRQDLFGVIDVLALDVKAGVILGVQATSGSNHSARVAKALKESRVADWLSCGGWFQVWSYAKRGARGKRKLWTRRRTDFKLIGPAGHTIGVLDLELEY
jgi:hypothetical protein